MSVILDALRRRSYDREGSGAPKSARADAVLATLGYSRRQRSSAPPLKTLALYGAGAILLGFVGLALLVTALAPPAPSNQSTLAQRSAGSPAPARVPTAAPPAAENPSLPPGASQQAPAAVTPNGQRPGPSATAVRAPSTAAVPRAAPREASADIPAPVRAQPTAPPAVRADPLPSAGEPSAPPALPAPTQPVNDFGRALFYQRFGDYTRASSLYADVLTKSGPNPVVHNNLGVMFIDRGEPGGAINSLMEAISLDPKYVKAQNNLGVAYLNAGRLEEATKALQIALAEDPRNVESMVNLALVHKAAGRPADARQLLHRAVATEPRIAGAHYNLALVADETGDTAVAAEHYRAFLRLDSGRFANLAAPVRARLSALGR